MSAESSSRSPDDATPASRTRRRGAVLENAILDAAWDELVAVGHNRVTVGAVASRAGTNKAVLYRRWPNRTELLVAAIDRRVVRLNEQPIDTGSLRTDVIALLNAIRHRCAAVNELPYPGGELAAHVRRRAAADGFGQMDEILRRAKARKEISDVIGDRMAHLPIHVLYSELALASRPVTDRIVVEIVDDVFLPLALNLPTSAGR